MNIFKKQWFALIILVLCIASAITIGLAKHESKVLEESGVLLRDTNIDTSVSTNVPVVNDTVKLYTDETVNKLKIYVGNWDKNYSSLVAFETVDSIGDRNLVEYASGRASNLGIGSKSAIFIMEKDTNDYVFYSGEEFPYKFTKDMVSELKLKINENIASDKDAGILNFASVLNKYFVAYVNGDPDGILSNVVDNSPYASIKESFKKIGNSIFGSSNDEEAVSFFTSNRDEYMFDEEKGEAKEDTIENRKEADVQAKIDEAAKRLENEVESQIELSKESKKRTYINWKLIIIVIVIVAIISKGKRR